MTKAGSPDWLVLAATAVLLFNAINGLATGRATLFYRAVTRAEHPTLYWPAVIGSAILGIAAAALTLVL